MKIEWHVDAVKDLRILATADQRRIKKSLEALSQLDDPRQKLVPYRGKLKDYWKLRVGDYRLVCQIKLQAESYVLIVRVAHRSTAYDPRSVAAIGRRSGESL